MTVWRSVLLLRNLRPVSEPCLYWITAITFVGYISFDHDG